MVLGDLMSTMVALIAQLGERQTEENINSHLKALSSIHGQRNFIKFNSSTEQIPSFPITTNIQPTIKLSIKSLLD